jgi:hypothetical protein
MLKKLALLAGLLTLLGGCATNSSGQITVDGQTVAQLEAQVKADVLAVCQFVPTATTLAQVVTTALGSGVPGVSLAVGITAAASNIATGICQAIAASPTPPPGTSALASRMTKGPSYCIGGQCVPLVGRVIH